MPLLLTEDALLQCDHGQGSPGLGRVGLEPRQGWLTIGGRRALVEGDLQPRPVTACPMITPTTPPCRHTLTVAAAPSYAGFVTLRSRGDQPRRLCLQAATGLTDWASMGSVSYRVTRPGQALVRAGA